MVSGRGRSWLIFSFQEDEPRSLVQMQKEHWDPLFAWVKEEFGVELALAEGFAPALQSEKTKDLMKGMLEAMDVWELAGESFRAAWC